jgi:hypothetical protein
VHRASHAWHSRHSRQRACVALPAARYEDTLGAARFERARRPRRAGGGRGAAAGRWPTTTGPSPKREAHGKHWPRRAQALPF